MSNYTWVIDAGHGGLDKEGKYTTDPTKGKFFTFPDGFTIYEGVINRQIANKLHNALKQLGIEFALVYDEVEDWSLTKRVALVNKLHKKYGNCILLDLHSNAGGGKGKGIELFTSPGETDSDPLAHMFAKIYMNHFPEWPFRKDIVTKELDKEANFTMVTDTHCPAILFENFFFDERKQADLLVTSHFQQRIVNVLVAGIQEIERLKEI